MAVTEQGWTVTELTTYDATRVRVVIGDGHGNRRTLMAKRDQTGDDDLRALIRAALAAVKPPGPEQPPGPAVSMLP